MRHGRPIRSLRTWTPTQGGVYYDGKDLGTLDLRLVRRQIGAVLETAGLIPGRIFDNISGSAPAVSVNVW